MYDGIWKLFVFKEGQSGEWLIGKVGFFNMLLVENGVGDQIFFMCDVNNGYGFLVLVVEDFQKLEVVKVFIKNFYNEDMQVCGFVEDGVFFVMKLDEKVLIDSIIDELMKEIVVVLNVFQILFLVFDVLVQVDVIMEISNLQI